MKTLQELALAQTRNNITTTSSRKSISDSLVELIKDNPMTKVDIVSAITLDRLQESSSVEINADNFMDDDVQKKFSSINKTVSNGFDTAVCNGKTNASFSFNEKYNQYTLVKDKGMYSIVDKVVETVETKKTKKAKK